MSGSGMIAARPEGLAVEAGEPEGCVSGWDAAQERSPRNGTELFNSVMSAVADVIRRRHALGIIMHAARKCTEVNALADRGAIERDGADLFIRRYSESICEIVAELVSFSRKGSN